jgi:hypothetical protein
MRWGPEEAQGGMGMKEAAAAVRFEAGHAVDAPVGEKAARSAEECRGD